MKKKIIKGLVFAGLALATVLTINIKSVSANSVFDEYSLNTYNLEESEDTTFTLEEMLIYAIQDEFLAKAEYDAIIDTFGEVMPFVKIVEAEQTHIDLLLPLFEAYEIKVPENNASDYIVIPESITSALATGVEAEEVNIAMYEIFLSQDNLPEDVKTTFEYLMNASENHLRAFSQDRYSYLGNDIMSQIKNQWKKAFNGENAEGSRTQNKGSNAQGSRNLSNGAQKYNGECQLG